MNIDLDKIKSTAFVTILVITIALISPGILFIFMYSRKLFIQTDTLKLILLGIAISSPIWILNAFLASFNDQGDKKDVENNLKVWGMVASIISIPVICVPTFVKLFFNINLQTGVLILIFVEIIAAIYLIWCEK
jgi:hypothetical protein